VDRRQRRIERTFHGSLDRGGRRLGRGVGLGRQRLDAVDPARELVGQRHDARGEVEHAIAQVQVRHVEAADRALEVRARDRRVGRRRAVDQLVVVVGHRASLHRR
jgi:hypothetical protein